MVLVGCAALTASCKQAPVAQMEAEYAVLKVSPSDKVLSTTYSATIRGRQDIDIYPQVSGFLTRLCVEEGQAVRKGQVLFIIDQVPYKAALETAVANVESAKAGLATIIRKSKFPQNPKRSVRFSGKRTKRSVQKRKARNTQKAETKVL